jgi:hypothetical protein
VIGARRKHELLWLLLLFLCGQLRQVIHQLLERVLRQASRFKDLGPVVAAELVKVSHCVAGSIHSVLQLLEFVDGLTHLVDLVLREERRPVLVAFLGQVVN